MVANLTRRSLTVFVLPRLHALKLVNIIQETIFVLIVHKTALRVQLLQVYVLPVLQRLLFRCQKDHARVHLRKLLLLVNALN